MLITVEGIDMCGKSTLVSALKSEFDDAVFTAEPDTSNSVGAELRERLGDDETHPLSIFHQFLADHYIHIDQVVQPALENDQTVICDRYTDSRYAYQAAALEEYIEGDALDWIRNVQETPSFNIEPDVTLLLDITVDEALQRGEDREDEERFEKRDFLNEVRENYLRLAHEEPSRFTVVNADPEADSVEESKKIVRQSAINAIKESM